MKRLSPVPSTPANLALQRSRRIKELPPWPKNYREALDWQNNPEKRKTYTGFYYRHDSVRDALVAYGVLGVASEMVICIGYHGPEEGKFKLIPEKEFFSAIKTDKYEGPAYILDELARRQEILNCLYY